MGTEHSSSRPMPEEMEARVARAADFPKSWFLCDISKSDVLANEKKNYEGKPHMHVYCGATQNTSGAS